jgi:rhodanese-related sulfurtransferase
VKLSTRRFKDSIFAHLARLGGAVAAPKRIELLELLAQAPRTVEVLAELSGLTIANTSRHLQVLFQAGLVAREKRGLYVEYRLAEEAVADFYATFRQLAQRRLAAVDSITETFLTERGALEAIDGEELAKRAKEGDVTVHDVRPAEEFRAGHLPGARSIPLGELEARLAELPKRRFVVAYCRGPYCVMAIEAVELLRSRGFSAQRFDGGVIDWRARGNPIETGAPA